MSTSPPPLRIYFIPLPSLGHVIPMVDVAKLFAKHNVECTLILTPLYASCLNSTIYHSNLKLLIFEFPSVSGLLTGCECTDVLLSPDLLKQPFRELVHRNPPDAVVSDEFFSWSIIASPELNIPHYSFVSTSCFALSVERSLLIYKPEQNATSDSDPFLVPRMPGQIYVTKSLLLGKEKLTEFFNCARKTKNATVGWVVNTFSELESEYIKHFERETGRPVFAVGPVCLSSTSKQDVAERGRGKNLVAESERLLTWLDGRPSFSVVYVCFGSSSRLPKAQLREIGFGLVDSKVPFIWVVGEDHSSDDVADEVASVAGESGQVIKGWAPQLAILGHIAVGTFVTHCGWGAVTEAVALGRLLLTWPLFGEQFYNEKFVVEVARTGESMGAKRGVVLSREKVLERVRWAHGTGAEAVRKRAWDIGLVVRREVVKGGSSYARVDCMIEDIRQRREKRMEAIVKKI